jgi:hypothetical protein
MANVIDLSIVSRLGRLTFSPKCLLKLTQEYLLEFFIDTVVDIEVIDSDTGLPTVKILAENNPFARTFEVSTFVYDDWAFATKLQNAGR